MDCVSFVLPAARVVRCADDTADAGLPRHQTQEHRRADHRMRWQCHHKDRTQCSLRRLSSNATQPTLGMATTLGMQLCRYCQTWQTQTRQIHHRDHEDADQHHRSRSRPQNAERGRQRADTICSADRSHNLRAPKALNYGPSGGREPLPFHGKHWQSCSPVVRPVGGMPSSHRRRTIQHSSRNTLGLKVR